MVSPEKVKMMREYLEKEYGIHNDRELLEALSAQEKIDISVFTRRPERGVKNG